ncbi:MAG: ComEC/Rec2 family competence protein, partial [Bacilli bacterium]
LYSFLNKKYKSILILVILIFIHSNINYVNKSLEVTYIDVSQGDSTLISLPYNKGNILIDTGGIINYDKETWKIKNNSFSLATDKIIPYLKSKGIKKLDYLIVTHGDYDHMGEAVNLVNNFKVEQIVFNCGEFNDLEKELIKVLEKKKIKYYSCIKELNIDNSKLYFLQTKEYDNENDNSNVIYTELNGYKFIFMGDAGVDKEKDILDKYNLSNVDVLKVGHHGSKTSSSKEFIDEINPKYGVISVGKNNRYGHPNKEVLNNLYNSKIYRTDQDGSIMFKIKKDKLQIETCSP